MVGALNISTSQSGKPSSSLASTTYYPLPSYRNGRNEDRTKVLVEGTCELVERRGHLEALLEDAALALDAHDLGPLDEAVEVLLGRKRAADAELPGPLLEQRVRHHLRQPNAQTNQNQTKHEITSQQTARSTVDCTDQGHTGFFLAGTGALPPLFGACKIRRFTDGN